MLRRKGIGVGEDEQSNKPTQASKQNYVCQMICALGNIRAVVDSLKKQLTNVKNAKWALQLLMEQKRTLETWRWGSLGTSALVVQACLRLRRRKTPEKILADAQN